MSKVKKWIVAIAIAIVFNLFVNYGVATQKNHQSETGGIKL